MAAAYGRQMEFEYESDDGESNLDYIPIAPQHHRKIVVKDGPRAGRPKPAHRASQPAVEHDVVNNLFLGVPGVGRQRASSTGGQPNKQIIYVQPASREPSRERGRSHSRRRDYDSDESYDSRHHSRSRHGSHSGLDGEIARKMAELELERQALRRERDYEREREDRRRENSKYDSQLAELNMLKDKRRLEAEEADILARLERRNREAKQKEEQALLDYREQRRQEEEHERDVLARAEAKRLKYEADRKAEYQRIAAEQKQREEEEKARQKAYEAAERDRLRREKEKADEDRKRIILEEEARKQKQKADRERLKEEILAEEEDRKRKEKKKAQEEEEKYQQKFVNDLVAAGYSASYIQDILAQRSHRNSSSSNTLIRTSSSRSPRHSGTSLAIATLDASRPRYIRVRREHLDPRTLDYYRLPWSYDPREPDTFIIIEEYIDQNLQQELFRHSAKYYLAGGIGLKKETLLVTDGFTKETTTTLTPNLIIGRGREVKKDKDGLYMVRSKSKSRTRGLFG